MRRVILLSLLSFALIGFSFADFETEVQSCASAMSTCYEKAFLKYQISKTKACGMKDGVYTNKPLQTSWPKKKSFSNQFYKYNNIIYYIVDVYPLDLKTSGYDIEHYLYSYNCKTKKVLDMNINTDNRWTIINILNAYKNNIVLNFFTDEGGGGIYMFDSKAMLLHNLNNLSSMKNYSSFEKVIRDQIKPYFDDISSKAISMGIGEYPTKIAGGNRDDFWKNVDKKISNGRTPFTVQGVNVKDGNLLAGVGLYVSFRNPNDELPEMILAQLNLNTKTIILP